MTTPSIIEAQLNDDRDAGGAVSFVEALSFGTALSIEHWRLQNGLKLLLLQDQSAPVVAYHTWFRVGSRYEEPGKTGLAHFFEHMMFNETTNLPRGEFDRKMEAAGGDTNAATWLDWTYFHQNLPASEVALAIALEADRMQNLVVRQPQVDSEREVVANERRMAVEDDIHGAAAEKIYGLTFGTEHPYGWPTIGWMKDIEAYTVPDCESFYRTWYAPNNATVVLVGDFDTLDVLRLFRQHYGPLKASEVPEVAPPPSVMSREYQSAMLEWPTPTAKVALTWMAPAYGDSDYAAALVLDEILTGGRSGRLRRRLVRDLEYVSEISTSMTPLRYPGLFEVWISMRPDQEVEEALTVVNEELARLQSSAVAEAELEKVRNRMELFFLSEIESVHGKAYQIGFADNVLAQPAHAFERLEELRRVRAEDVQRVARRLFAEGPVARLDVTPKVSA